MSARVILFQKILFCLLIPVWCGAIQPYTPVMGDPVMEPWRWRHENALDGLNVLCMDEAADGTLWFGNVGSIASYDGRQVTTLFFDAELLSKIIPQQGSPWAKALQVLPSGELLVLLNQTLVLRTGTSWRVIIPDIGTSVFSPKMIQCEDGTLWLMGSGALWRMTGDFSEVSAVITVPATRHMASFCLDGAGTLWTIEQVTWDRFQLVRIPSRDGVFKEDQRKAYPIPFQYERGDLNILARSDGTLVVATSQHRVCLQLFDPKRERWEEKSQNSATWAHYSLTEGTDGSVWVGQLGALSRLTPDKTLVEYPDLKFELPPVHLSLFEASNDRLWIIGRIGQVCSVDLSSSEWTTYLGINFEFETEQGVEWFRAKSVHHVVSHDLRSGKWRMYGPDDGLVERTHMLFYSSHGLVWAAGCHDGRAAISVFDGVKWTRHVYPQFAELILPNSAFEASDGTVWFGAQGRVLEDVPTAGGALQFRVSETGSVELVKHHAPPAFPYYVTAFAQTPDQTLWLGSTVIHAVKRDASVRVFPEIQGENVVAMTLDREKSLWVAKEHFGVCRWRDGFWEVFDKKDGLLDLNLGDLLVLSDGSLLVSSSQAISRFDGTSWFSDVYPEWFGMSSRWSSLSQSPDGAVWFNYATADKRMNMIFPETAGFCAIRHRPETDAPKTQITEYLKRVSQPGNTHIRWTARDLWQNTPLNKIQYSWRLDGAEWSPFSRDTERMFLSLGGGRHVLDVRARDERFNVDLHPDRIEFTVIPPVWKQAWFITLISVLVGLIVLMVWLLIRTRERNARERQAEREAFLERQQHEREQLLIEQQREKERNLIERQAEREQDLVRRQQEQEERLLKQQQDREAHLREMDRLKMGFFTNISHELRTPITVVAGRLQTIFTSNIDDQTKRSLSIVMRNVQRVSVLITQLLDFRKIQEGKINVDVTHGDLVAPLRDWIASLQVLAEQAQISLSLYSVEECRGWFDFDKIQKIFTNLIANSIKYTDAGGAIVVILQEETDAGGGRQLRFIVEDTGQGISPEHLPHIFDRFYRVSEASMAEGAGIGLNLTKELVGLLGGEIGVDSPIHSDADRPGTRFTVCLPLESNGLAKEIPREQPVAEDFCPLQSIPPAEEKRDVGADPDKESPLILIIEDDLDIRSFIAEGLEPLYQVKTAENGEIGLQMARELIPDLVVTDLMMPLVDGLEVCSILKSHMETSHIPVVMLTAKTALDSQIEGLKRGADDYILKPFHMELLLVRIANLLESRKRLRETFRRDYPVMTSSVPENTPEKEFLDKALHVVQANYADETFNPETLAALLHMGLRTLQRKLKAVTDHTPIAFINEYRIVKAAELLQKTSRTVADITFDVGYDDPSNFSRMFKKRFGMSPSEYRAAHPSV